MLIFAVDTSGRHGSLALAQGDTSPLNILEMVSLTSGSYSSQLIPQLAYMLDHQRLAKNEISAFAVVHGPGSFTGLRVGLSTVKALAEVMNKPIAAMSSLEVVAWTAGSSPDVVALLDAGRGQIFAGSYEFVDGKRVLQQSLSTLPELLDKLPGEYNRLLVTPDESLVAALQAAKREIRLIPQPQADAVANIGIGKILRGEVISPELLDANYIRRSDAELFSLPRVR